MDIILFCYTFYLQLCGMEASEKAKHLVLIYMPHCSFKSLSGEPEQKTLLNNAKNCAFIAVDLVLTDCIIECIPYWNAVRREIEKL
jgi:hypothetical protein